MSMYFLYSFLLFVSFLVYLPVYFFKIKLKRREPLHFMQRLGFGLQTEEDEKTRIWIHAVSVGEVLSLQNFMAVLKKRHPDWKIFLSTLTHTGFQVARKRIREADRVFFVPFDFGWTVRRFFRKIKPDVFILAESEFWPYLLREAERKTLGVLLINGRISEKTFKRLCRFRCLTGKILRPIRFFLVQTETDKKRLDEIGISLESIRVAGNLKADIDLPLLSEKDRVCMKKQLHVSPEKTVFLAGSVHKQEDVRVVEAFAKARKIRRDLQMIIAPRHLDRVDEIEKACRFSGLSVVRKTHIASGIEWDVLIMDTIGELARLYAVCDLAFLGGSLIPWGGQNFLEPAFYGKAVFFGPHMENFSVLAERFLEEGAATVVIDPSALKDLLVRIDKKSLEAKGKKAKAALESLRGATAIAVDAVESMMQRPQSRP